MNARLDDPNMYFANYGESVTLAERKVPGTNPERDHHSTRVYYPENIVDEVGCEPLNTLAPMGWVLVAGMFISACLWVALLLNIRTLLTWVGSTFSHNPDIAWSCVVAGVGLWMLGSLSRAVQQAKGI
jgi:hypothetical protein